MIKFLKKFKEKILIALACSFIGIGTLLTNTLETKAYYTDSDTFSYTLTYDSVNGNYLRFNLNNPITTSSTYTNCSYYMVLIECDLSRFNISIGTGLQYNFRYNNANQSLNYFYYRPYTNGYFDIFYRFSDSFNVTTSWTYFDFYINNYNLIVSDIVHIDLIPIDNLTTYENTYNVYGNLQQQYDSLQAEYSSYQNTHAYTNEQYNSLMTQNATLTQQVQSLQSQYDTYVSLHSYTNTQYETLLNNYNNLQTMYNSLQQQYLALQQEYNRLTIDLAPFKSSNWINRQAILNGVSIDVSSSSTLNSVVWFRDSYLQIDQRDFENFSSYIEGENNFQLVTTSNSIITINSYTAIANFASNLDYGFSIQFYLNNNLINTTTFFDGSMTTDDGGTTNTFNYNAPITFNRMIIDIVGGPGPTSWTESSYFKANPGTWQMGYDYAVEQLQPRIDALENSLEQAINQQQVKYNEGYNQGISDSNSQPLYGMVIRIL